MTIALLIVGALIAAEVLWVLRALIVGKNYDAGYHRGQVDARLDNYNRGYQDALEDVSSAPLRFVIGQEIDRQVRKAGRYAAVGKKRIK